MENYKAGSTGNKYFLQAYRGLTFRHGGIGNLDAESILEGEGFKAILLPDDKSFLIYGKRWLAMRSILRQLRPGDIVVCQFPVYPKMYRILIRKMHCKGVKLIAFLADIDGLKDSEDEVLQKEIRLYSLFRYFIVHNAAMENWLRKTIGGDLHLAQLGPFDFLTVPVFSDRQMNDGINFSGNLDKSAFLASLEILAPLQFHLYGEPMQNRLLWPSNIHYHGVFMPYELPGIIKGSYGLVWDGDSIHGPSGSLGNYMAFINHHKLSLYILAGLPVIAPSFAGSAPFILENGIGWVVNDLLELPDLLKKISPEAYRAAREKMKPIALEISNGNNLRNAINSLISF